MKIAINTNVEADTWRRFKATCAERGISMRAALDKMMEAFCAAEVVSRASEVIPRNNYGMQMFEKKRGEIQEENDRVEDETGE